MSFDFGRTSEPEFDQWRWAPYWEPVREVIYFKRAGVCAGAHRARAAAFPRGKPPPLPRVVGRGHRAAERRAAPAPADVATAAALAPARHCSAPATHAPLVVRAHAPALRNGAAGRRRVLIGLFALYVVYELGRYNAGYDRQAVAQQRTELEVQIEHLEKDNRELRTKVAELDTIRVGRAREQAEVARAIGDLQAQVARQSQELAFYRGVVAQGAASIGLKIEQLRITARPKPGTCSSCTCRWCAPGAPRRDGDRHRRA